MLKKTILSEDIEPAYAKLCEILAGFGSLVVAYSGGVDSGLLAWVANRVLGDRALAVIGVSPSLPSRERKAAIRFLDAHDIPYEQIDTHEMSNESYRRNNPDRCYFCKAELFTKLHALAHDRRASHIAYGANVDDQSDHRPGAVAAMEHRVVTPLVDAGLGKDAIRRLARELDLTLWDKPAAPCLASRVPYFRDVNPEKLGQIERAEYVLKDLGFEVCRVRHYDTEARIEIPKPEHPRIRDRRVWNHVVGELRQVGFQRVTLDEEGFRSGRLNDHLSKKAGP